MLINSIQKSIIYEQKLEELFGITPDCKIGASIWPGYIMGGCYMLVFCPRIVAAYQKHRKDECFGDTFKKS